MARPPTLANAVADALASLGVPINALPPERLVGLIAAAKGGHALR